MCECNGKGSERSCARTPMHDVHTNAFDVRVARAEAVRSTLSNKTIRSKGRDPMPKRLNKKITMAHNEILIFLLRAYIGCVHTRAHTNA